MATGFYLHHRSLVPLLVDGTLSWARTPHWPKIFWRLSYVTETTGTVPYQLLPLLTNSGVISFKVRKISVRGQKRAWPGCSKYAPCLSTGGDSESCKGQCFTKQEYISTWKHKELPSNGLYGHRFCSENYKWSSETYSTSLWTWLWSQFYHKL